MSALSPRQMFLLDMACAPLRQAFPSYGPYLVGTAMSPRDGRTPRDIDVRCIVKDKKFDKFESAIGTDALAFLGMAIGQYLHSLTGLPIDFQFQRQTEANHYHSGPRNPLGRKSIANFPGDAPRLPTTEPEGETA